jgi:putative membrane protein
MNLILFASSGPHHWWFLFFPLAWILVIALLIRFVFMRGGWGCWSRAGRPGERAHEILAERYARGEIGDDEYRTRRERLRADG